MPKLRPYLIVAINKNKVKVLTVSSLKGKEHKLIKYKDNFRLTKFKPPFNKESFVKLDSCQEIDIDKINKFKILSQGKNLNKDDLDTILSRLKLKENN